MTNLDAFLLKGPPGGDVTAGLADLRYSILVNGIPSNSDGMVSPENRKNCVSPVVPVLHTPNSPLSFCPPTWPLRSIFRFRLG